MSMSNGAGTATKASDTSPHEMNIFRTALRQIGRGFVEIAQGTGLIAVGTLRPVRSLVPSLIALASIATLTTVTLVLVVTAVAQADAQHFPGNDIWSRWNNSPEIRFGDNTGTTPDLDYLTEADAWSQERGPTAYATWELAEQ